MFRALLWKEWRELWMLPVTAGLLVAWGFFITKGYRPFLTPDVWEAGFSFMLFLAASYIPIHLYTREKEAGTLTFLMSRSLDRFRLWWFKLITGAALLFIIGLVLYGVITGLCFGYPKAGGYEMERARIIKEAIGLSFLLASLSMVWAALFRRQLTAAAGSLLSFFLIFMLWGMSPYPFNSHGSFGFFKIIARTAMDIFQSGAPVLCPALLLASLVIFARRDVWRRTRASVTAAYAFSAMAALVPMAIGGSSFYAEMESYFKSGPNTIASYYDVSEDGKRVLLRVYPERALVLMDLTEGRVNTIEKSSVGVSFAQPGLDYVIYAKHRRIGPYYLLSQMILSDFQGIHKRRLFDGYRLPYNRSVMSKHYWSYPFPVWSLDGDYIGLVKSVFQMPRDRAFLGISDSEGNIVGQHVFPKLERPNIWGLGWDFKTRFYFQRFPSKGLRWAEYWRVRPDNLVPERMSFIPPTAGTTVRLSPDGKWFTYGLTTGTLRAPRTEMWLYDILKETAQPIPGPTGATWFSWSRDGKRFAYIEREDKGSENEAGDMLDAHLILKEPDTGNRISILLESLPNVMIDRYAGWSPSGKYLLITSMRRKDEEGKSRRKIREYKKYVYSIDTKEIIGVPAPGDDPDLFPYWRARWVSDDRLVWRNRKTGASLMMTEFDGSNPREFFSVRDGKYYLFGEEQI